MTTPHAERRAQRLLCLLVIALALGAGALGFGRKLASFQPLGFRAAAAADHWRVESVAAAATGLEAGDRILLVDGATAGRDLPERLREGGERRLVVARGDGLVEIAYLPPPLAIDLPYVVLALVGLLYLGIALFALWRPERSTLFVLWCAASAGVYLLSPVFPLDGAGKALYLLEGLARVLLPPLTLHLFLSLSGAFQRHAIARRLRPWLYLPAALLLAAQLDLALAGGRFLAGQPVARAIVRLDRLEIAHLGLCSALAAVALWSGLRRQRLPWEERRVMQWLAIGATAGYLPFALLYALPKAAGLAWPPLLDLLTILPLGFVPVAFAWALLRYRLWDVGILFRQGLAYGVTLTGGLGLFALLDLLIRRALPPDWPLSRDVASFAVALGIAALVVPTQRGVSSAFERLHYGPTYRRRRALAGLGRELLHERDLDRLSRVLVAELADAFELTGVELLLVADDRLVPALAGGHPAALYSLWELPEGVWAEPVLPLPLSGLEGEGTNLLALAEQGFRYAFPLSVRRRPIGLLLAGPKEDGEPLNSEDLELTRSLLDQAALAIENARLLEQVQGQLQQVTDLKRRNEGIIESSPAGIAVLDETGVVRQANLAFAELVGLRRDTLPGQPLAALLPVGDLPLPGAPPTTVPWRRGEDDQRHLQLSVAALRRGPEPGGRILVVQDVSERARMEQALKEQDRLASLGLLAAGVAHEVNTPLTGISSYAQMLLADTPEDDPRHALLRKVERQTFRAAHIVNGLLDFARQRHRGRGEVDLRQVAEECLDLLRERLSRRAIRVVTAMDPEPVRVLGDEGELQQVVTNLLLNAVDAMPEGGTLTVAAGAAAGRARLTVADTGCGIPPENLGRVFDPLFTTRAGQGGTGLGLAISQQIVVQHGGRIEVASRPGEGARFTLDLPEGAVAGTP